MIYTNSLTPKGQITIPKALRTAVGLQPGQAARIELLNERAIVITAPIPPGKVRKLVGKPSYKQPLTPKEKARLSARGL